MPMRVPLTSTRVLRSAKVPKAPYKPVNLPQKDDASKKNVALEDLSLKELREALVTQQRMMASVSLMSRLPDKGAKIKARVGRIEVLIAARTHPSAAAAAAAAAASAAQTRPMVVERPVLDQPPAAYVELPNDAETVKASIAQMAGDDANANVGMTDATAGPANASVAAAVLPAAPAALELPRLAKPQVTLRNVATAEDDIEKMSAKFAGLDLEDDRGKRIWQKLVSATSPPRKGGTMQISHAIAHEQTSSAQAARQEFRLLQALSQFGEDSDKPKPLSTGQKLGQAYMSAYALHLEPDDDEEAFRGPVDPDDVDEDADKLAERDD